MIRKKSAVLGTIWIRRGLVVLVAATFLNVVLLQMLLHGFWRCRVGDFQCCSRHTTAVLFAACSSEMTFSSSSLEQEQQGDGQRQGENGAGGEFPRESKQTPPLPTRPMSSPQLLVLLLQRNEGHYDTQHRSGGYSLTTR